MLIIDNILLMFLGLYRDWAIASPVAHRVADAGPRRITPARRAFFLQNSSCAVYRALIPVHLNSTCADVLTSSMQALDRGLSVIPIE